MSKISLSPNASGTGTFTIAAPDSSTDRTLTLPDNSGTLLSNASTFAGTGPAFSAYQTSGTSLSTSVLTKILFQAEEFDTNSSYDTATSKFTPNVAGYYFLTSVVAMSTAAAVLGMRFYKNGVNAKGAMVSASGTSWASGNVLLYLNGSTDYVEVYVSQNAATQATSADSAFTWFAGAMVRAA